MIKEKHDMTKDELKNHEHEYGRYNYLPPNFKEITEKEFVDSAFFTYNPELYEFRQVIYKLGNKEYYRGLKLYYFHDGTGIGIMRDFENGKVHYFKFAKCEHEMVELGYQECQKEKIFHAGSCYHVYKCLKCGHVESRDSSG